MARRFRRRSSGSRVPVIGGILRSPWVQKTATGLGMGTIAALITARFAPQFTQIASLAGAYAGGGLEGVIGGEAVKAIAGAPSALSGVVGTGGMPNGGSVGFA
jgi:hypothetical protein